MVIHFFGGRDKEDVYGNCGAISFIKEIFSDRLEVPYRGSHHFTGGIPASVCMEGRDLHGTHTRLDNGGKLFVISENIVGLLKG